MYHRFNVGDIDSRQTTSDRRRTPPANAPIMESGGQLLLFDRRRPLNRRLNNFNVSAKIACSREYKMTIDIVRTPKGWTRHL